MKQRQMFKPAGLWRSYITPSYLLKHYNQLKRLSLTQFLVQYLN